MSTKTLVCNRAVRGGRTKGSSALERKVNRRKNTKPAGELHKEWVASMRLAYPDVKVEAWGGAEMKLASTLVKNEGFDRALDAIQHFVSTWKARRRDDSLPVFKVFWTLRERVLAEIDGKVRPPMTSKERLGIGEFDRSEPDNPDVVCWGDILGVRHEDSGSQG